MTKFVWVVILAITIGVQAFRTNIPYAVGQTAVWFGLAMIVTAIWWAITKRKRLTPWRWFDWLNVGTYTMAVLIIVGSLVLYQMVAQVGR